MSNVKILISDPWKFQRWCTTSTNPMVNKHKVKDYTLGQPCFETHPHIVKKDEVGAGIRREEFQERRSKLMTALLRHGHSLADKPSEHFVSKKSHQVLHCRTVVFI